MCNKERGTGGRHSKNGNRIKIKLVDIATYTYAHTNHLRATD